VELLIQPISGEIRFPTLRQWFHVAFEVDAGPLLGGFPFLGIERADLPEYEHMFIIYVMTLYQRMRLQEFNSKYEERTARIVFEGKKFSNKC
jgi:hypothetical protein